MSIFTLTVVDRVIPCDRVVELNTLDRLTDIAISHDKASITCCCHHTTVHHHLCAKHPVAKQRQLRTKLRCSQQAYNITDCQVADWVRQTLQHIVDMMLILYRKRYIIKTCRCIFIFTARSSYASAVLGS